ncbi:2-hydroxychromene-2-carboxylate isomerase [Xaviernesmea oryzae]|uniref:2-hydroxychromene-2-carboxylate isomerase n=1 Tax=Xaviernesmea oryzae TaxID=464029 RepID=A0A1Q9AR41_9HYPH|nr:DsbA family protein [Xaviernesmea oryzae]OLP57775.1 2-hydroxychromene-2-carboxylate isomerase [Xaviernesmea oryzae]SEM07523.1 2-hydroxychromene-2-carboxylate isomerase [Xaviernesmea oryzae]
MSRTIDYFFSVGSPWAYIGFDAFLELAERQGATVRPHIISLIEENGAIYSRNRPEARRAYWYRDLSRWAALRGKPLALENRAGLADAAPAGRLVIAAEQEGLDWIGLTRALQSAFWGRAEDIGQPEHRAGLLAATGFDAPVLEARAAQPDVDAILRSHYAAAKEAGVFGIPTFRYEGELYWGQDSLPFLERHLDGKPLIA